MKVFAVFQEGVYRHRCGGIFSTVDEAIAAAEHFAATDRDSYHTYDVIAFQLDALSGVDAEWKVGGRGNIVEAEPLHSAQKAKP